jgi:hypothetical protein
MSNNPDLLQLTTRINGWSLVTYIVFLAGLGVYAVVKVTRVFNERLRSSVAGGPAAPAELKATRAKIWRTAGLVLTGSVVLVAIYGTWNMGWCVPVRYICVPYRESN